MKIGITGQFGFIGSHLKNFLTLQKGLVVIPFANDYFSDEKKLQGFVSTCDVVVHLAAVNRHTLPQYIYEKNVELVQQLINACEITNSKPHILFSSSIQEEKDNLFGNSKKVGRELLEQWAFSNNTITTGMLIPNVFGPFGKPYYNSVVATFCYQLIHDEVPSIIVDGVLPLIYINELVEDIHHLMVTKTSGKVYLPHRYEVKVSEILGYLQEFKNDYFEQGIFPNLTSSLKLALFNTFRCYIPKEYYPRLFKLNMDNRGTFVEIARTRASGQFSYSTTKPNITRGNHFHTRKVERFAVIKGKGIIKLRKIDTSEIIEYFIDGDCPAFVDIPIWFTHNITNIGDDDLITLFWISEPYNSENPDTYFVNV